MTLRRWATGGVLALGLLLSAFSNAQERLFTPEEMRADIAFMLQTFEEVHPNLYAKQSQAETATNRQNLESKLVQPLSIQGFYSLLAPFVETFEDGHTSALPLDGGSGSGFSTPYGFTVPKTGVGLIDFREMRGLERFQGFLESTFTQIQTRALKTLIVDLRSNGGGDSALGTALLDYLTDQPYRLSARAEVKVSTQMAQFREAKGYGAAWPAGMANGAIFKTGISFDQPTQNALRFKGNIYVLISKETFSSAMQLASAFKDFKVGTLVGEETKEPATSYGEPIPFTLPNTGLEVRVSSTYWIRPSGLDDGRGVIPDVNVPSAQALQWVLEQVK
jgi:hypothetical protein